MKDKFVTKTIRFSAEEYEAFETINKDYYRGAGSFSYIIKKALEIYLLYLSMGGVEHGKVEQ